MRERARAFLGVAPELIRMVQAIFDWMDTAAAATAATAAQQLKQMPTNPPAERLDTKEQLRRIDTAIATLRAKRMVYSRTRLLRYLAGDRRARSPTLPPQKVGDAMAVAILKSVRRKWMWLLNTWPHP